MTVDLASILLGLVAGALPCLGWEVPQVKIDDFNRQVGWITQVLA